ncbi:MAG: hypothetical protein E4H00_02415 [Myxococcales bacterium]|nr:MAG: hypothetical protein E4H00_02415 [Myxococcales bacterium]
MGIIRNIIVAILFVAAVYIASANVQLIEIVYLPTSGVSSGWDARSIELPVFVVVLGGLVLVAVFGGAAGLFEQGRLRLALRKATKAERRANDEIASLEKQLTKQQSESSELQSELDAVRSASAAPPAEKTEAEGLT